MASSGTPVYLFPAWPDTGPSTNFFQRYPALDGIMNWWSWPYESQGNIDVSTYDDLTYMNAARSSGRSFRMGASPLQYKHVDYYNNFYLRGKGNFDLRVEQILQLQPDMVEFQTWNDVGEGHNMGYSWPEAVSCCANIQAYSVGTQT